MKIPMLILLVAVLLVPVELKSQGKRYQHPVYDISFVASPNWTENCNSSRVREYCVVHPNNNMEISLRFVPDCGRPQKYMRRLSGLKGLVCHRGDYDTILNNQEAMVMTGNCLEGRESYSTMVIGFPKGNGLYLMEISCPDNCTPFHHKRVMTILNTVHIGPVRSG